MITKPQPTSHKVIHEHETRLWMVGGHIGHRIIPRLFRFVVKGLAKHCLELEE